jgi:hypothetical protein
MDKGGEKMATDKKGNYIKGTKKELPKGWVTYGFRYAIFPAEEDRKVVERSFGCERKVYNEYVAGLYEHLEKIGFQGGFIQYKRLTIPPSLRNMTISINRTMRLFIMMRKCVSSLQ